MNLCGLLTKTPAAILILHSVATLFLPLALDPAKHKDTILTCEHFNPAPVLQQQNPALGSLFRPLFNSGSKITSYGVLFQEKVLAFACEVETLCLTFAVVKNCVYVCMHAQVHMCVWVNQ